MKKFKKTLLIVLSLVLVSALSVVGTVAYLTSQDSDVNVMTLGNVKIEQHEYERVVGENGDYTTIDVDGVTSYELQEFTQAKPLLPIVGDPDDGYDSTTVRLGQLGHNSRGGMDVLPEPNVQDKFVVVENTGKTDAYVRTIVAFEAGSVVEEDWYKIVDYSSHFTWKETQDWFVTEIDGNNYYLVEFVYNGYEDIQHPNGVLTPGDYTYNSLAQVYLKSNATNEDCEALDGNGNGTLDILVISQAAQTAGFADAKTALDTAFGEFNETNVKSWFETMAVPKILADTTGVNKSTNKNGAFVLADDIETTGDASIASDARYGYGYEYIIRGGVDYTLDLNGKTISHKAVYKNDNHNALTYLFVANHAGTKLTIDGNGEVYSHNSEGYTCAIQGKDGTLVTVNGGDYQVDNGIAVWAGTGSHIVINGGSFVNGNCTTDHELIYSSGGVIDIYGGFFHNTDGNYTLNVEDKNRATGFINVYGGTYVNFDPSTGGQDPNNIKVADGYKVVSETQANGDVWYTVVAE